MDAALREQIASLQKKNAVLEARTASLQKNNAVLEKQMVAIIGVLDSIPAGPPDLSKKQIQDIIAYFADDVFTGETKMLRSHIKTVFETGQLADLKLSFEQVFHLFERTGEQDGDDPFYSLKESILSQKTSSD